MNSFEATLYRDLRRALEEEIASRVDALSTGSARDIGEYKAQTGEIRGLRRAADLAESIHRDLATQATR